MGSRIGEMTGLTPNLLSDSSRVFLRLGTRHEIPSNSIQNAVVRGLAEQDESLWSHPCAAEGNVEKTAQVSKPGHAEFQRVIQMQGGVLA